MKKTASAPLVQYIKENKEKEKTQHNADKL